MLNLVCALVDWFGLMCWLDGFVVHWWFYLCIDLVCLFWGCLWFLVRRFMCYDEFLALGLDYGFWVADLAS